MHKTTILAVLLLAALPLACDKLTLSDSGRPDGSTSLQARRTPWTGSNLHGVQLDTEHYRIYTTSQNESLVGALPGFMEAAHGNYRRITGLADEKVNGPMVSYIMGTRPEWTAITESRFGKDAPMLSIESGGYCADKVCVLWDMGGLGTLSTASHEGLHQFLGYQMRQQLPMWLEEGLCTLAEGYEIYRGEVRFRIDQNVMRFGELRRRLMRDQWTPTKELLPMDAGDVVKLPTEDAVGYYGQLWALSLMLRTDAKYRAGLERLIRDAHDGKLSAATGMTAEQLAALHARGRAYNRAVSEKLFRYYISNDLDAFDRDYKAFAHKLVQR